MFQDDAKIYKIRKKKTSSIKTLRRKLKVINLMHILIGIKAAS